MLASYFVKNKVKSNSIIPSASSTLNSHAQDGIEEQLSSLQSFSFAFQVDEGGTTVPPTASTVQEERKGPQLPQTATQRRRSRRKKTNNAKIHGSDTHDKLENEFGANSECGVDATQAETRIMDASAEAAVDFLAVNSAPDPTKTLTSDGRPSTPSSTRHLRKIVSERQKKKQHGKHSGKKNPKEIAQLEKQSKPPASKIVQKCICFNSTAKGSAMVNKSSLLLHSGQKQQQKQNEVQQQHSSPFTFGFDIRM
jgi:hypothetical protein